VQDLINAYRQARRRLLLLDYDGTLAAIAPTPEQAAPTPRILQILTSLTKDPANTVVAVSGRTRQTMDDWLGATRADLSAEHGLFNKTAGAHWQQTVPVDQDWQPPVQELMQAATDQLAGSFVEHKTGSLAWHYRLSRQTAAAPVVRQLHQRLTQLAARHQLTILSGRKVLEARPAGWTKASAVSHWLTGRPFDFILAAGDDATDEDTFAALPKTAWTLKIGSEPSLARQTLPNPAALLALLDSLI